MDMIKRIMPLILLFGLVWGQSEAGAIFLLIEPGASATGMGRAQVAYAQSSIISYYNPAGLSFLKYNNVSFSRVNWLPSLADDLFYNFLSFNYNLSKVSTIGGHIINLDLGEQIKTSNTGDEIGTYNIYKTAFSFSYSLLVSNNKSFGINAKLIQQQLSDFSGAGEVKNDTTFTDYGFDIGYMHQEWILPDLNFGISISNLGNEITLFDDAQSDPQPTNFALGFNYTAMSNETHKLNFLFDINKLLIASYPDMDWDGDGYIGGYDNGGNLSPGDDYNINGQLEIAHTDPLLKALYTSWFDDWLYPGDIDYGWGGDRIIGGYDWVDLDGDGKIDLADNEMVQTSGSPGDEGWGKYGEFGIKEVGSKEDGKFQNEIDEMVFKYGAEYQFNEMISLRGGYYSDKNGNIEMYTVGLGIRYMGVGFDYSHYIEEEGHPLNNTNHFSLSYFF